MAVAVKTEELVKSLLEERITFTPRDDWRRAKTDIVLLAIKRNKKNAVLEDLQNSVVEVAREKEEFRELEESSLKLLRIHYLSLSRTNDEKVDYLTRRKLAAKKLDKYKKKYNINNF